ncbi:MAG: B12-binding domain-containing radical SAM protein [Solidesulfovibrio sp. DCME]|uniref:B12-binding domain-containing radical SAM protein n=1 Tax=Solidesulfovibrio sp. DCME TaxID=3447380 RepID=UPI003D0A0A00
MIDALLINPPLYDTTLFGKLCIEPAHAPPLGISYLAACLERDGFEVVAHDAYYDSWPEVERLLAATPARLVGVSCLTDQRASSFRLVRLAHRIQPGAVMAAGGIHATLCGRQMLLDHPELDLVVLGEAENTLGTLLRNLDDRSTWAAVPGIGFRRPDTGAAHIAPRVFTGDLDGLPFPAYRHFAHRRYVRPLWLSGLTTLGKDATTLRYANVLSSRGCTHHCLFCASPASLGRRWTSRTPLLVVDELAFLTQTLGYEYIAFSDEVFTENPAWTMEICAEICRRGMEFAWECQARANAVTPELLAAMRRAGCLMVAFGIESFSDRILREIRKDVTQEQAIRAIGWCQEAGIAPNVLLMVGNPGESDKTVGETRRWLERLQPHAVSPDIATIFPGTGLFARAIRTGGITPEFWSTDMPAPYYTVEHPFERLYGWYRELLDCNRDPGWFEHLVENPTPCEADA